MPQLELIYNQAIQAFKEGKYLEAARSFQYMTKQIDAQTDRAPFHLLAADALFEAEKYKDAVAECRKAIEFAPNAVGYRTLGRILLELGNTTDAEGALRLSIKLAPTATAYFYLARLISRQSPIDAEKLLRRAIEVEPDYEEAYFQLGKLLFMQLRKVEAQRAFQTAIRIDSRFTEEVQNFINSIENDDSI